MVEFQVVPQAIVADDSDGAFLSMGHSAHQWSAKWKEPQSWNQDGRAHASTSPRTSLSLCFKVCEMARNPLPLCHLSW